MDEYAADRPEPVTVVLSGTLRGVAEVSGWLAGRSADGYCRGEALPDPNHPGRYTREVLVMVDHDDEA